MLKQCLISKRKERNRLYNAHIETSGTEILPGEIPGRIKAGRCTGH